MGRGFTLNSTIQKWAVQNAYMRDPNKFLPFHEARAFVHTQGINHPRDWKAWASSPKRPANIPAKPNLYYKNEGWISMTDWILPIDDPDLFFPPNTRLPIYKSFEKACEVARGLGLRSRQAWLTMFFRAEQPPHLPRLPYNIYPEWESWDHWLGCGRFYAVSKQAPLSFEDSRSFARSLGLRSQEEWLAFTTTPAMPKDVPVYPELVYPETFLGWQDWLGDTFTVSPAPEFVTFTEARKYAVSLNLYNFEDWLNYAVSSGHPANIPVRPDIFYEYDWTTAGHFLGRKVSPTARTGDFPPYTKARDKVRERNFTHPAAYHDFLMEQGKRLRNQKLHRSFDPKEYHGALDAPIDPKTFYRAEWSGWDDWLGVTKTELEDRKKKDAELALVSLSETIVDHIRDRRHIARDILVDQVYDLISSLPASS